MKELLNCRLCPRNCGINRVEGKSGFCRSGANPKLALASVHMWEEPCISGTRGSGTVFFSHCNLKCVFCQNFDISQQDFGKEVTIEELAQVFINQQKKGVHNINLVSPTQYLVQIKQALIIAKQKGLNIPVVYNTNGYESVEGLKSLEGLIDIYLPDFKYADNELAKKYSGVNDYFEKTSEAILEMYSQTGYPVFDGDGIVNKGLIIRHLVLPGQLENSKKVLRWIQANIPKDIYISLMCQYTPMHRACDYPELNRRIYQNEYDEIIDYFFEAGLENGFVQELSSAEEGYIPKFNLEGV
ncbi:MAG: radical SAM protein [Ignavibacteriales bacterium]